MYCTSEPGAGFTSHYTQPSVPSWCHPANPHSTKQKDKEGLLGCCIYLPDKHTPACTQNFCPAHIHTNQKPSREPTHLPSPRMQQHSSYESCSGTQSEKCQSQCRYHRFKNNNNKSTYLLELKRGAKWKSMALNGFQSNALQHLSLCLYTVVIQVIFRMAPIKQSMINFLKIFFCLVNKIMMVIIVHNAHK